MGAAFRRRIDPKHCSIKRAHNLLESLIMVVLRKRSRLVYFRVSDLEFEKLTDLCQRAGATSLSELARGAIQRMLNDQLLDNSAADLQKLHHRVEALDAKLDELVSCLHHRSALQEPREGEEGSHNLVSK